MAYKIHTVPLKNIEENPHRMLKTYPTIQKKIDALMKSFLDVGCWPGLVARPHPTKKSKFQLAFGHHRFEAAKKLGMKSLMLSVDTLNDEEMLRFMGRENGEDYRAEFLSLLNTWEAGVRHHRVDMETNVEPTSIFISGKRETPAEDLEIATVLGWVHVQKDKARGKEYTVMNMSARACSNAFFLISIGKLTREALDGANVRSAYKLTKHHIAELKIINSYKDISTVSPQKRAVMTAKLNKNVENVAKAVASGEVAEKDIDRVFRETNPRNEYLRNNQDLKNQEFSEQAKRLLRTLEKTLATDASGQKLADLMRMVRSKKTVLAEENLAWLRSICRELEWIEKRSAKIRSVLEKAEKPKIVKLKKA